MNKGRNGNFRIYETSLAEARFEKNANPLLIYKAESVILLPRKAPLDTMKPQPTTPKKNARRQDKAACSISRASRAPYVFAIYRETARAIENAAFSVPRASTADRPKLLAVADALREGIQAARLPVIREACARAEEIPLARRRFPCPLAWTRFLARIAPEQSTLAV